jgi:hypothetical protein
MAGHGRRSPHGLDVGPTGSTAGVRKRRASVPGPLVQ